MANAYTSILTPVWCIVYITNLLVCLRFERTHELATRISISGGV